MFGPKLHCSVQSGLQSYSGSRRARVKGTIINKPAETENTEDGLSRVVNDASARR